MIKGIDHQKITVNNMEKSLEYYKNLGFEIEAVSKNQSGMVEIYRLRLGEVRIDLVSPSARPGVKVGLHHIAFSVDDTNETYKDLKGKGLKFNLEPMFNPEAGRHVACFEPDPDGVWFHITSNEKG